MSDAPAPTPIAPRQSRARWLGRILLTAAVGAAIGAKLPGWLKVHSAAEARAQFGLPIPVIVSIALWVGFSLYWWWAARNASVAARSETSASRMVHLVIISAGQMLVLLPVPGLRGALWPASPWIVALGLAVNVGALALAVWARRVLGRHWSGEITTKVDHELITSGPYAFVRHPIYTGMLALCVGTTLVYDEWHALAGTLLVAISYARKIRLEEKNLSQAFGAQWDDYRARVKGLIPGVY